MGPPDSDGVSRVPSYSGARRKIVVYVHGAVTRCGASFQMPALSTHCRVPGPTTPGDKSPGLGCSDFARRYSRNHCCFLFLRVLRCFTSPGLLPETILFITGFYPIKSRGLLHSEIRGSIGRLHLTAAYRSLPRPSSPPVAKASTIRPYSLAALILATSIINDARYGLSGTRVN